MRKRRQFVPPVVSGTRRSAPAAACFKADDWQAARAFRPRMSPA